MTKRLDILVNLIKQGNGGKLAKDELGGVELSAKEAEISVKALDTKYQELVQEISKGNKTIGDAQREYRDFAKQLGVVESQSNDTQLNIITLNQALELGQKAFNGISQAAEITFENLQQAERVEALRNTFDNLAGSLGNTDDLLNRLKNSTSGAVNQTVLMEAANKALNLRLASTDDELVKLVSNAAALGANLGDVGGTIDNVLAAIANESRLRLDNFGVAASRVDELQEQLRAAGEEGTFAQAVMIALEETVDRTGARANLAADDMSRLQAAMQDARDEALVELIAAFGEDFPDAVDKTIGAIDRFSAAVDSDKIRTWLDVLSKYSRVYKAFFTLGGSELLRMYRENQAAFEERQAAENAQIVTTMQNTDATLAYIRVHENLNVAISESAGATASFVQEIETETRVIGGLTFEVDKATGRIVNLNKGLLHAAQIAHQELSPAIRTSTSYFEDEAYASGEAAGAMGDLTRQAQEAAAAQDEVAEATINYAEAAQLAREAELDRIGSLGDYATSIQLAADNTYSAADAAFQHIDAMNASPEATIAAGLALGIYTEAQAKARLQAVLLEAKLREVDQAIEDGRLTQEGAIDAYIGLAKGTYDTAAAAIYANDRYRDFADGGLSDAELGAGDLTSVMGELKARLLGAAGDADAFAAALRAIPNEIAVKILLEQSGSFVPPPDSVPGGQYGGPRAAGGPVEGGTTYMVGERGRELFIPGASGHIVSNQQVERALQNISNRTVHYSDRSSVNFNMRGLNVRQAGRSLNRSRRQHLNRSLYG